MVVGKWLMQRNLYVMKVIVSQIENYLILYTDVCSIVSLCKILLETWEEFTAIAAILQTYHALDQLYWPHFGCNGLFHGIFKS